MARTNDPDDSKYLAGYTKGTDYDAMSRGFLDISQLQINIDIAEIDKYPNEAYALLRKNGFGTSDSSIVLGVNPFTTRQQLVEEKCRDYLTQEELEIGTKEAVVKGRELEPIIIAKHMEIMNKKIIKPVDMFSHKDFPWLKFNFDGVVDKDYLEDGKYQYIPDEIKVLTRKGKRHYNLEKAWFEEIAGFNDQNIHPPFEKGSINTIQDKAAAIGIPPYYYTQLQQQMLGLNAPFGYLTIMTEWDWRVYSFFVWRDDDTLMDLIIQGSKLWNMVQAKRPASFDIEGKVAQIMKLEKGTTDEAVSVPTGGAE
jgi:hypothetical protein